MERQTTPLWDASLGIEQRLDWLLEALSLEEKLNMLSTLTPEIPRLGIRSTYLGEDAHHGVEAKHDRRENWGEPRRTTSFPQPIGMSQTWDPDLLEEIGEAVSREARILYEREDRRGGLNRWSPMAEPARDPRWGRTEESFGEDPLLAGEMAAAYVRGMRGSNPDYIRTACTLRQYYGGSREKLLPSASIDPRSAAEYYTDPYRRCIEKGGAWAVMAADNVVNGVHSLLNPELNQKVRGEWKLPGYIMGGEGALRRLCDHSGGSDAAKILADALLAGVDCFADDPGYVSAAAHEAYDRGLLSTAVLNRAIRNSFRTRLKLGMFNREEDAPFSPEPESVLAGEAHEKLAETAGERAIVLLKNEDNILPLEDREGGRIAVIGPMADEWLKDWYGAIPPYSVTPLEGIRKAFPRTQITYTDGRQRILVALNGQYLQLRAGGELCVGPRASAEEFVLTHWGGGRVSLQASSNGLYVTVSDGDRVLRASRSEVFGHPVRECFYTRKLDEGWSILDWDRRVVRCGEDGIIRSELDFTEESLFRPEYVWNGEERAITLASEADTVLLVLGTNPVIGGCAGEDRETLRLPEAQQKLCERLYEANRRLVLVIVSNYPHSLSGFENVPAILYSPSGCQSLGTALASIISGKAVPSGHLSMTWVEDESFLPDMDDYDIRKGRRTYQYLREGIRYPFGYGLSYTAFSCEAFALEKSDDRLSAVLGLSNRGNRDGFALVRLFGQRETAGGKKERKRLIAFKQVFLEAGKSCELTLDIPLSELLEFDVITESMVLPEGSYRIWLGDESTGPVRLGEAAIGVPPAEGALPENEAADYCLANVYLEGDIRMRRDFANRTAAGLYDDCRNICHSAMDGQPLVTAKNKEQRGVLVYEKGENSSLSARMILQLCGTEGSSITVSINRREVFTFDADTAGLMAEEEILLPEIPAEDESGFAEVRIELAGNAGLSSFWFA